MSVHHEVLWKPLWKLPIVPKVIVFWWRVLKNILPSYAELKRRYIMDDRTCKLRGSAEDILFHALTERDHARLFWSAVWDHFGVKLPNLHPRSWTGDIIIEFFLKERNGYCDLSYVEHMREQK